MDTVSEVERPDTTSEVPINPSVWLSDGCWPPKEQEQVVVLVEDSFGIGTVQKCFEEGAEVLLMKSIRVRGQHPLSHWVDDSSAKSSSIKKESILPLRPVFEVRGSRKTLKMFLVNLDLIKQFVESLVL